MYTGFIFWVTNVETRGYEFSNYTFRSLSFPVHVIVWLLLLPFIFFMSLATSSWLSPVLIPKMMGHVSSGIDFVVLWFTAVPAYIVLHLCRLLVVSDFFCNEKKFAKSFSVSGSPAGFLLPTLPVLILVSFQTFIHFLIFSVSSSVLYFTYTFHQSQSIRDWQ